MTFVHDIERKLNSGLGSLTGFYQQEDLCEYNHLDSY